MKQLIILLIKFYKTGISPFLPSSCRFYPSCSEYALEAVQIHGTFKGSWLALKRILRCHPFNKGGYDPVPSKHKHELSTLATDSPVNIDIKKHYEIM